MQKEEWWKDFFSGLAVETWCNAISEEDSRAEADFIESSLHVTPTAKILDVPCGFGRLSIELAVRGFQLSGVDISSAFLEKARVIGDKKQLRVQWEQRDMRDLPWTEAFDGAFCFGNSFGYLNDEGNLEFLKAIHRVLRPGARFILDASSVAENIFPKIEEKSEMQIGDILFKEENRYDHVQGRLDTEYTFVRGDQVEKKFGSHRLYTYREICLLLEKAGFENYDAYGSIQKDAYTFKSPGLYMVAEKSK